MTLARKGILYATAAFALAFALAPVNGARADVVYDYEGAALALNAHDPFKTTDKVIGTITFATPLAANLKLQSVASDVVSFSFTAGVETMNSVIYNPSFSRFNISTDAAGHITGWDIVVAAGGLGQFNIENSFIGNGDEAFVGADNFFPGTAFALNHTVGEFTIAAPVPEPATWAMMLLGFCGLGFMAYRRKAPTPRLA